MENTSKKDLRGGVFIVNYDDGGGCVILVHAVWGMLVGCNGFKKKWCGAKLCTKGLGSGKGFCFAWGQGPQAITKEWAGAKLHQKQLVLKARQAIVERLVF